MARAPDRRAGAREIVDILANIPLMMRTIAGGMKPSGHGIMPAHLSLLALLANEPCNLSALADKQAVSLPTMSNSISVLVERGWVKRTQSPHDRRMVLLELTPAGRAVLTEIKRQAELRVAERLAPLSQDDYQTLLAGLAVLRRTFIPIASSDTD
jgi:DNA-binding MarR family transcriptional regulator